MAPRSLLPCFKVLLPARALVGGALVALVSVGAIGALGACWEDPVSITPAAADGSSPVSTVASATSAAQLPSAGSAPPSSDTAPMPAQPSSKPSFASPPPLLAAIDRAGTLHVLDENGAVQAQCPGRATDVVSIGATIATFEPATSEGPGAVRMFTLSGSTLVEGPARLITSETGGLVTILPGADAVIAWEEAERASLLVIGPSGSGGLAVGSPASIRLAALPDGEASLEVLVTASGAPRIDRFRAPPTGALRALDDFAVPLPPDVEARMVAAPDSRLLVTLEDATVRLRDEAGGEEAGPNVAAKATLEDASAHEGRLVLLLGAPARLLQRDLDGVYTSQALPEPVAHDPRPSHRLSLGTEAIFVVTGQGLAKVRWATVGETTKTADEAPEHLLVDAVAVVGLRPE